MTENLPRPEECNCFAVRSAARHVSQYYDRYLATAGLRTTQFSILAKLKRLGPLTINELARQMVMDRTTLGRNIKPLEAFTDGVVAIIITIMVLEMKVPPGSDIGALQAGLPIYLAYVLSY